MKKLKLDSSIMRAIKEILTFRFLTEQELETLVHISRIEKFDVNEKVISQGEINQSFYAIINGTVKVTVQENKLFMP